MLDNRNSDYGLLIKVFVKEMRTLGQGSGYR
jgi:hypothetical protein